MVVAKFNSGMHLMPPKPTRHVETAPLFVSFSENGLNGLSVNYQRHLRDKIVTWTDGSLPRPVHYNCWEAIISITRLKHSRNRRTRG